MGKILFAASVALLCFVSSGQADNGWGSVKGRLVLDDEHAPAPKKLNVNKDQDHCLSKGDIFSEELVVHPKNMGIRWAFVWLAPVEKNGKIPIHPSLVEIKKKEVEIDQPVCKFVPHAFGMRVGQELVAKNSSPAVHNINWVGINNPGGNVIIPAGSKHVIKDLVADRIPLTVACNIHPWMSAKVRIFDHPYFATTDENGKFEIENAPAGNWRLVMWQESVGYVGGRDGIMIEIKDKATTDAGDRKMPRPQN